MQAGYYGLQVQNNCVTATALILAANHTLDLGKGDKPSTHTSL